MPRRKTPGLKPPRKTLGDALKEVTQPTDPGSDVSQDPVLKSALDAAGASAGIESHAAQMTYGTITYPKQPINDDPQLQNHLLSHPEPGESYVEQGSNDLGTLQKKALLDVAADASLVNDYPLSPFPTDNVGGRRGEPLISPDVNLGEDYYTKHLDATSDKGAYDAFNSSLGFYSAEQVAEMLSKISELTAHDEGRSGHNLLSNQKKFGASNNNMRPPDKLMGDINVSARTHDVLNEKNRFSPSEDSPYIKDATAKDEKTFFSNGLYSVQVGAGTLGVYTATAGQLEGNANAGKPVHTIDLRQMALQMCMRSQAHRSLAGMIDEEFAKGDFSFMADLAALIPGLTQVGIARISQNVGRIKKTDHAANLGLDKSGGQDDFVQVLAQDIYFGAEPASPTLGSNRVKSAGTYGNLNSFAEPFDGAMPMGMLFIAVYSILVMSGLASLMQDGNTLGHKKAKENLPADNPFALPFGSHSAIDDGLLNMFLKMYGVPRLQNPFFDSVAKGISVFYDIPDLLTIMAAGSDAASIIETVSSLALSSGYYTTITKQVLRDFEQITKTVLSVGFNASVLNVASGVFRVVESLYTSFTFRFLAFLAIIGDIHIRSISNRGHSSQGEYTLSVADKDLAILPTPYARMRTSRLQVPGSSKQSPAVTNPLSLATFPSIVLAQEFGGTSTALSKYKKPVFTHKGLGQEEPVTTEKAIKDFNKIHEYVASVTPSNEQVQAIENSLELEYMPFYIHDLRTNELISMPAFISSFTEDFAPEYSENHGYGRTDGVMTYTKTKRNIGLTFRLVAFSEADHEYMWFVVNKLVSMCYPQRSAGLKRAFNDGLQHFMQPFSQVPVASPMVRLRLGEVLHSNYSKRNLGRLFGMLGGPGNAAFDGTESDARMAAMIARKEKPHMERLMEQARRDAIKSVLEGNVPPGETLIAFNTQLTIGDGKKQVQTRTLSGFRVKFDKVTINHPHEHTPVARHGAHQHVVFEGKISGDQIKPGGPQEGAVDGAAVAQTISEMEIPPSISDLTAALGGKTLHVKYDAVVPGNIDLLKFNYPKAEQDARKKAKEEIEKMYKEKTLDKPNLLKSEQFLSGKSNPIVASFESNRGRGLAGFITQLGLGYEQSNWETSKIGARAPQSVTVTMQFAPIHDLPLGLDADGQLIAPSHPVRGMGTDPYADGETFDSVSRSKEKLWSEDPTLKDIQQQDKASWAKLSFGKIKDSQEGS